MDSSLRAISGQPPLVYGLLDFSPCQNPLLSSDLISDSAGGLHPSPTEFKCNLSFPMGLPPRPTPPSLCRPALLMVSTICSVTCAEKLAICLHEFFSFVACVIDCYNNVTPMAACPYSHCCECFHCGHGAQPRTTFPLQVGAAPRLSSGQWHVSRCDVCSSWDMPASARTEPLTSFFCCSVGGNRNVMAEAGAAISDRSWQPRIED